jgi:hypothetical protein
LHWTVESGDGEIGDQDVHCGVVIDVATVGAVAPYVQGCALVRDAQRDGVGIAR